MMSGRSVKATAFAVIISATGAAWAGQQPASPMAGVAQAALLQCAQAHAMAERTLDTASRRLEAARLANSPTAMRTALDDLQGALRQLRADIAPCAALRAPEPADPHAGHVMPPARQ